MMSAKAFWLRTIVSLLVALSLAAWLLSQWYLNNYIKDVGDRAELLMELRKGAIEQYFSTARAELTFWSSSPDILSAQQELNTLWGDDKTGQVSKQLRARYTNNNTGTDKLSELHDAPDGSLYSAVHSRLHPLTKLFVSERGYYDMFLIGSGGDVYYTVEKESDFGSNLLSGPLRDSALAYVFSRAMVAGEGDVVISDMRGYEPSNGAPAIFIAKGLRGENGALLGVIAFQLPTDKILDIMGYTQGMGDTGETYLVGEDRLMRSNSRFSDEPTVLAQRVDSTSVEKALAGESGVEFVTDYRGVEVMSAYSRLAVGENNWAVIAEFDRDEIVASSAEERPALTGTLLFIYGLSMWSAWYWRGGKLDAQNGDADMPEIDLEMTSLPDASGLAG